MKNNLTYVSEYMKALVITNMPGDFTVAELIRHGLTDDELRRGMMTFRDFHYAMFDKITANQDTIDVEGKRKFDIYGTQGDRTWESRGFHLCITASNIRDVVMPDFGANFPAATVIKKQSKVPLFRIQI
ncbi:MAG: hypothetical protein FWE90_09215 [Defluviitaleaceae bacterium]|nr:hypothetical protein [Defluviitaleaceae bacterium]